MSEHKYSYDEHLGQIIDLLSSIDEKLDRLTTLHSATSDLNKIKLQEEWGSVGGIGFINPTIVTPTEEGVQYHWAFRAEDNETKQ